MGRERQIFDKNVFTDIGRVWDISKLIPEVENKSREPPPKKQKVSESNGVSGKVIDIEETSEKILSMLQILSSKNDLDVSCELLSKIPDLSTIGDDELNPEELKVKLREMSEAETELQEQSKILQEEIEPRTSLDTLLTDYVSAQRKLINKKKERLKNCQTKLQTIEDAKCYVEGQLKLESIVDDNLVEGQLKLESIVDDELDSIPMPDV